MYDSIIYIYNKGLQDYVAPLEDLTTELQHAINAGKQLSGSIVAHLTLYVKLREKA